VGVSTTGGTCAEGERAPLLSTQTEKQEETSAGMRGPLRSGRNRDLSIFLHLDASTTSFSGEQSSTRFPSSANNQAVLAPWDICSEKKGTVRSERPRSKGECLSSGKEQASWGKEVVVPYASAPGLPLSILLFITYSIDSLGGTDGLRILSHQC
jgi:hypothetical protein